MTALLGSPEKLSDDELLAARVARPRRTGQWLAGAVAAVLLAMLVHTVLTNPRFQWDIVGQFFTSDAILHGLVLTLWLTAAVMICGYLLGTALAAMRLSRNVVLRSVSFSYVWLIRSIPPLVLLLFWYELASLYPRLPVGVSFGPEFAGVRTAHLFWFGEGVLPELRRRGLWKHPAGASADTSTIIPFAGVAPQNSR
jgi:polar amino acid transport system permease protein